jgi:hypothetical protein
VVRRGCEVQGDSKILKVGEDLNVPGQTGAYVGGWSRVFRAESGRDEIRDGGFLVVLDVEPSASHMLGQCSTTDHTPALEFRFYLTFF